MIPFLIIAVTAGLVFLMGRMLGWNTPKASPTTASPPVTHLHPAATSLRDLLFGDAPLEQWCGDGSTEQPPPWNLFALAKDAMHAGRNADAVAALQSVAAMPDLESRHYLQAWHFLRLLSIQPPADEAKQVLGVVVEVGMPSGLDILAAYADCHARYFHCAGGAVVWERPNASLDPVITQLLRSAGTVAQQIGPWDKARPGPPPLDQMRLSFLTPSGLHFGQAALNDLHRDPLAKETVAHATDLMQRLIDISQGKGRP